MATNVCCGCYLADDYGTSIVSGDGSQENPYSVLQVDPTFNRPVVKVVRSSNTAALDGVNKVLDFDSESFDTDDMFSYSTPTRLTIKIAGVYLMGYNGLWGAFANLRRETSFRLNGVTILDKQSQINNDAIAIFHQYDMTYLWPLSVNDYIEIVLFQTGTPSIAVSGTFWMMYLGKAL